jgi:hypothetical protein
LSSQDQSFGQIRHTVETCVTWNALVRFDSVREPCYRLIINPAREISSTDHQSTVGQVHQCPSHTRKAGTSRQHACQWLRQKEQGWREAVKAWNEAFQTNDTYRARTRQEDQRAILKCNDHKGEHIRRASSWNAKRYLLCSGESPTYALTSSLQLGKPVIHRSFQIHSVCQFVLMSEFISLTLTVGVLLERLAT